jgi:hypothetical protein
MHQLTSSALNLAAAAVPAQIHALPVAAAVGAAAPPSTPSAPTPLAVKAHPLQHLQHRLLLPQRRCTCRTQARQKGSGRTPCCLSACRSRCRLYHLTGTRAVPAAALHLHVLPAAGSDAGTCSTADAKQQQ